MKISQKKTCRRCVAREFYADYAAVRCTLGYPQLLTRAFEPIPMEPCPKPLTNSEWCDADRNPNNKDGASRLVYADYGIPKREQGA